MNGKTRQTIESAFYEKLELHVVWLFSFYREHRPYPLVPAPIQARDIPTMHQQQYLDERHIQLYQPITTYTAQPPPPQHVAPPPSHHNVAAPPPHNMVPMPPQNSITVLKNEPAHYELKNGLHHTTFQNPMIENGFTDHHHIKNEKSMSPMRPVNGTGETRKKDRRKARASSLESSAESESSAMETGDGNSGQVAAISSTASFKSPVGSIGMGDDDMNGEKQVKFNRFPLNSTTILIWDDLMRNMSLHWNHHSSCSHLT